VTSSCSCSCRSKAHPVKTVHFSIALVYNDVTANVGPKMKWSSPKISGKFMRSKIQVYFRPHRSISQMRPVATDAVGRSVGRSVLAFRYDHGPWKRLNRSRWDVDWSGRKELCVLQSISPHVKGRFWGRKRAGAGHVRRSIYSKRLGRGQDRYGAGADWGVLDGVHVGATWWIRLNCPCGRRRGLA